MKKHKKLISFVISIFIVISSFFQYSIIIYADDTTHGGGGASRPEVPEYEIYVDKNGKEHRLFDSGKGYKYYTDDNGHKHGVFDPNEMKRFVVDNIVYIGSTLGAIVDKNFGAYLSNTDAYMDKITPEKVYVNDDTGNLELSADLVSTIKQALREYSEETNGYWLISTPSIRAVNPQHFTNLNAYITLQNLINKHDIIAIQMNDSTYSDTYSGVIAAEFSEYISSEYNLVCMNGIGYDPYNATSAMAIKIYDSVWTNIGGIKKYVFDKNKINSDITDGYESSNSKARSYYYFYVDYPKYHDGLFYRLSDSYTLSAQDYGMLISKDGCRLRVFKSENAMKAYDTGTRTVYFGTDFYEKDPVDITITIDDLDKYINTDFDKYFGQLKDTIMSQGQNLKEQDVEKLTDSILGKLTDIDNSIGEVGDSVKDTNNLLSQILARLDSLDKNVSSILTNLDNKVSSTLELDFSGIEERLDTIIMSLGIISGQLDDMTTEEIENRTDEALQEMQDEFSDIGEVAKTKFPLSLPWDLGKAFDKIGGGDITSGESPPEAVAMLLYDEPDKFVHTMSLYNDDGIALYASEDTDSSNGGGYFPSMEFSVDSLRGTDNGSHTSSGGYEHGGGGASRWGAWHSDTGAPIFYMPVEFSQSMKIGGLLIIDLSGFEVLHSIGRLMFSVIFCMNLVHLTFKAISAGKDLLTW